jgi:hypothetical protein
MSYNFIINPLGEILRNDEVLVSSVNVSEVAKQALEPAEFTEWMKMPHPPTRRSRHLEAKVQKEISSTFKRQKNATLTQKELELVRKVEQFQVIEDGRFRVYGGIDSRRKPWIRLVTEFANFTSETDFWKQVRDLAKQLGAKIEVMHEEKHLDKMGCSVTAKSREQILSEFRAQGRKPVNGGKPDENGVIWSTSPDHGRPERQIEMYWDVLDVPSLAKLRQLIAKIRIATAVIWKEAGVGVC